MFLLAHRARDATRLRGCLRPLRRRTYPVTDARLTYVYIYIYGFLVCRYARSLGLAACQNTPALDAAFYYPISTLYQLQPSFHTESTEPEPTARARRAGEELY